MSTKEQFFEEFRDQEIKQAFLSQFGSDRPSEQIISICETVFNLIDANEADIPRHLTDTLWHLQKMFRVYKNLLDNAEHSNLRDKLPSLSDREDPLFKSDETYEDQT